MARKKPLARRVGEPRTPEGDERPPREWIDWRTMLQSELRQVVGIDNSAEMAERDRVVTQALAALNGAQHEQKKKATILAVVEARLAGKSEETVWKPRRRETGSRSVFHEKWKKDPIFAGALDACWGALRDLQDSRSARALNRAASQLSMGSPAAALLLLSQLESMDELVAQRAALGILDRADVKTAAKGSAELNVGAKEIEAPLDDDEQKVVEQALRELSG